MAPDKETSEIAPGEGAVKSGYGGVRLRDRPSRRVAPRGSVRRREGGRVVPEGLGVPGVGVPTVLRPVEDVAVVEVVGGPGVDARSVRLPPGRGTGAGAEDEGRGEYRRGPGDLRRGVGDGRRWGSWCGTGTERRDHWEKGEGIRKELEGHTVPSLALPPPAPLGNDRRVVPPEDPPLTRPYHPSDDTLRGPSGGVPPTGTRLTGSPSPTRLRWGTVGLVVLRHDDLAPGRRPEVVVPGQGVGGTERRVHADGAGPQGLTEDPVPRRTPQTVTPVVVA